MMRILLTGSTGRLGGAFESSWGSEESGYTLRAPRRAQLDLSRPDELAQRLESLWRDEGFEVIINPAAVSGLEQCLDEPDLARAVNVDAPQVMAEFCQQKGIRMVHFSTDYVFSGEQAGRKFEEDLAEPVNVYGVSKLAGENAVLAACPAALVARVSWLFGPSGKASHFEKVLELASRGEVQYLIDDKFSVPTYTQDIVEWIALLLERECSGVYHLCNAGEAESWLSYAQKVCDLAGVDVGKRGLLQPISIKSADFFREKRPVHTAMIPARLMGEGVVKPRHWVDAAKDYLASR